MLKKFGIEVVSVENAEIGNLNKIREAAENIGALVALEVANLTGECCICDDCMLSVNALGGRPGFAANILTGGRTSDEAMDDILLALKQTAEGERNALMTCVLVFARPSGGDKKQEAEMFLGEVRGSIASDKCSEAGCDFERIFMPEGYGLTLAQFPIEEKTIFPMSEKRCTNWPLIWCTNRRTGSGKQRGSFMNLFFVPVDSRGGLI